jgi:hypothetical protein
MIVARFPFVSALLALASACFTSGCPMLVGDEFQIGDESSRAGDGGEAQAGAETSGAGTLSLGGHLHGGAAGHPPSSAEGGAAGTPANAEGGASAGDTNAGGPSAGSQGTCDDGRQSPGESDRDCGGACEPCEDGSSCRVAADCENDRCTASGICRSCGLRLTSTETACPAACTRCLGGTCYIDCDNAGVCRDMTLVCPPGLACRVECSAENGCSNLSVECPNEFPCDVSCAGEKSCVGLELACTSGPCALGCGAAQACDQARISCGTDRCSADCAAGAAVPELACDEACECLSCG